MRRRRVSACPNWLYRFVNWSGRIPKWVSWLWPTAHWCPGMASLLVIDNVHDCFCGHCGPRTRQERRRMHASANSRAVFEIADTERQFHGEKYLC